MKTLALSAIALLTVVGAANAGIINGDFEAGNGIAPSTSNYTLDDTMYPPATWNVVSFDTIHPAWVDFFDHTRGNSDGHFMIVNGTDSGFGPAWGQTVSVSPGTEYNLSAWFASLYPASVAGLSLRVFPAVDRGFEPLAGVDFVAPSDLGVWAEQTLAFNSGIYSAVTVEIWDINQAFSGNDYAIDDIALREVPAPGAVAMMGLVGVAGIRRRR
jgi:MYXO-CTERM domain-containing protein